MYHILEPPLHYEKISHSIAKRFLKFILFGGPSKIRPRTGVQKLIEGYWKRTYILLFISFGSVLFFSLFFSCGGDNVRQTNKCSGLRVGSRVQFTAKIEVLKCPKDPREWDQTIEIYPVGINEKVVVDLSMMCQCDCEKPGNPVNNSSKLTEMFELVK